jgi:hypothetical protein
MTSMDYEADNRGYEGKSLALDHVHRWLTKTMAQMSLDMIVTEAALHVRPTAIVATVVTVAEARLPTDGWTVGK